VHPNLEAFYRPTSLEEAVRLLSNPDQKAIVVAGATEVSLRIRGSVKALVDISGLGLDTVEDGTAAVTFGAMVRATTIVSDPAIRTALGDALVESAFAIASEPIRNLTSIGGNAVHVTSWSDMPPALRVLDARFRVQGLSDRSYSESEFFERPPKKLMSPGDLLTSITVPKPGPNTGSAFLKHATTAVDFALVNAAAFVELDGDTLKTVRLSIGAIHTPPIRLTGCEDLATGKSLTPELLLELATAAAADVSPVKDPRASDGYLRHCAGVLTRRALKLAADRARENG
jgi:carbon-monoxide dehydrogenase medium subunit